MTLWVCPSCLWQGAIALTGPACPRCGKRVGLPPPPPPPYDPRCQAKTRAGRRCKRAATDGDLCAQHDLIRRGIPLHYADRSADDERRFFTREP